MQLPDQGSSFLGKFLGKGLLFALVLIAVGFYFLRPTPPDPKPAPQASLPPQVAQPIAPKRPQPASTLPYVGGPEGYASSAACQRCHENQHESWHRSYHRTMTQALHPTTVQADFEDVDLDLHGERFHLSRTNDTYWVSIGTTPDPTAPTTQATASVRLQMEMLTGSHHMQVFWLPGMMGNMQIGFPFTWLIEDERWVPRQDTFIRDPKAEPVVEVWNQVCIRCHTTGGIPKPNPAERLFESETVELGIACEACHGPGGEHIALHTQAESTGATVTPEADPIIQPTDLPADRAAQVCGYCHSMKWFDKSEDWEAHGFTFRPGDDLNGTTPVIKASDTANQPWLHGVLERNPGLLESFFWSDGMIRVSGREYNGLIESACHTQGEMTCFSCHSMHNSEPNDQLARNRSGNQACTQCHESIAADLTAHTHHAPTSTGSSCYNCHMPHTTYGILKAIRSHEIDSPTVATEQATGRPNACNLCHTDQTLAWTADHLNQWYGQPKPELSESETQVPAIAHHLLAGDAGQRALAAWTLGWPPAQAASGTGWQAPLLARSLDDPYSAVRYIAGKSLRSLPGFSEFEYDFVAPEPDRTTAVDRATEQWTQSPNKQGRPGANAFFGPDGFPKTEAITTLWNQQDNTPIRLRE